MFQELRGWIILLKKFLDDLGIELSSVENAPVELDMFEGEFVGQCVPLFRWVGGKTQLLSAIRFYAPRSYNTYFEPFVGAGALLFDLMPKKAVINDINEQIIGLYKDVKDNFEELKIRLLALSKVPSTEEVFLKARQVYNSYIRQGIRSVDVSALFMYISANCFNGLYRVNRQGEFNVGFSHDSTRPWHDDNFKYAYDYFNSSDITILSGDFMECTKDAKEGDFVYFDPPYIALSDTKNFDRYSPGKFKFDDQVRLAGEFRRLTELGVKCMLSNSDSEVLRDLYEGFMIRDLNVNYYIQPTSTDIKRSECLVLNF